MALNFPNTPTNAQSYVDPNGHIWVYETATNSWTAQGAPVAGMVYKGPIDVTTAPPTGATTGSLFTVSTGGTPNAGFVGLPTNVPVGSQVIFDGAKWQLMSTTQPDATETVKGIVELATAAETTTGADATRAVHPAGLKVELDKKAPLASPALTGTPTAPTAAAGTNTTQLATTAFVAAADKWTRTGTTLSPKTAGDVVTVSAGTAALPGLTPVGDPDTGIYSPGADQLAISTGATERMRIANGGEVLIGTTSTASGGSGGNFAFIAQCFTNEENRPIAAFRRADLISAQFFGSNGGDGNAANCIMRIRGHSSGNRSINAGGSVNATGADYAEYMTKAGNFEIAKGDVCGVTADGKLTNVFTAAIGFVVKSTDPSYVGNDVWGIDIENDEQREAARTKVDRIAFAGQVPVNVTGATPGQYIVPVSTEDGGITGIAKDEGDLTLAEYMRAVGKVIAIEDNGRARIIVKVA